MANWNLSMEIQKSKSWKHHEALGFIRKFDEISWKDFAT